eukprot:7387749-Prymnesium_polylepis.1
MLTNIAQNAAKHSLAGFVELSACAAPADDGAAPSSTMDVELVVRDSGRGLSEESRRSCFNKYTTSGGVGLGLYLTKLQVWQLGGGIEVESPWATDGTSGTAFKLTLPLTVWSAPLPEAPEREAAPMVPARERAQVPVSKAGVRIVVADDNYACEPHAAASNVQYSVWRQLVGEGSGDR